MASSVIYEITRTVQGALGGVVRVIAEDMIHDRSLRIHDLITEQAEIAENCACDACTVDALIYRRVADLLR